MCKEQWIADVERLEEQFADDKLTADEFAKEMRWMGFDPKEIAEIIARVKQERGDDEPELTNPSIAIPRMINSIVADMDELCAAANRPETTHIVEADAPAFGQIILRCHLILGFLEARKAPTLKVVGGNH